MLSFRRLAAAGALLLATVSAQAGTVSFPAGNPAFELELPRGWTSAVDEAGNLDVNANDDSGYTCAIIPASVGTEDDVKALLPVLAKSMRERVELTDYRQSEIQEQKTGSGMKLMMLVAGGKTMGLDFIITLTAFSPKTDVYFVIVSMAEKSVDKAHDPQMGQIVESIRPAR